MACALLLSFSQAAFAQSSGKRKGKKPAPTGKPVLWKDPGNIGARDLFQGPGGEAMRPDTSEVSFIKAGQGGYSTGFIEHYLLPILYPSALTRDIQFLLGVLVVGVNLAIYIYAVRQSQKARIAL